MKPNLDILRHAGAALALPVVLSAPLLAHADALPVPPRPVVASPQAPALRMAPLPNVVATPHLEAPAPEVDSAAGQSLVNPFGKTLASPAASSSGQTLTAPVTVNSNASTDGITVTQTGTGRAINGVINNPKNTLTALKGATNGVGAALGGLNSGTAGPAGQFQITNASSAQPGLVVTTAGTGNGIQAIVSQKSSGAAAVLGQNNVSTNGSGVGVEGDGGLIGVKGISGNTGLYGSGSEYGAIGVSDSGTGTGIGVYARGHNIGLHAETSGAGSAVEAIQNSSASIDAPAVLGQHTGVAYYGIGVEGDGNYIGVKGTSTNTIGVYGVSTNGEGVYGYSPNGYAGYFSGTVLATGIMYAQSYAMTSDRHVKQAIEPVDTGSVLDRVATLPIASWDFKTQPGIHHIGPMAQDFRAAFGLGIDDKHIDMVDGVGVSLAAIQELQRQAAVKDARIEALEAANHAMDARLAALERSAVQAMAEPAANPR